MADPAEKYKRVSIRRATAEIDIWFINNCIKEQVTPNFAKVKTSNNVPSRFKADIEYKILRSEICKHYARLDFLNCELRNVYDTLYGTLTEERFRGLLNDINDLVTTTKNTKFNKVKSKLDNLIIQKNNMNRYRLNNSKKFSDFKFHDRIKNLSDVVFEDDELDLLRWGLKYCIRTPIAESDLLEFSVELDVIIEQVTHNNNIKKSLRNEFYHILYKANKARNRTNSYISVSPKNVLKKLTHKIKQNNLIITKADKGNCLVVLNKQDYITKVETFLNDNNFKLLTKNPQNTFIARTKKMIKHFYNFFEDNSAPKTLISSNPSTPRLYGLPKIHKDNIPIRPVVSFTNTPVSIISSFLLNLIRNLTNFKPKYGVSNSFDLANKLNNITLPENYLIVSFDVTNLFTTVPNAEAVKIVGDLLRGSGVDENKVIDILALLNLCLSQNFFKFNDKFYQQPDGLAMGSSLSPFLADVFMDFLENNNILSVNNPEVLHWFRYVDDCLVFLNCDEIQAQQLLDKINIIHPNIKFTLEIEQNNKINFLDLTIIKSQSLLEFAIYRKPTQTDHTIPNHSNHPHQHKFASFHCYINRLLNIPLSISNYNKEVNILKQIAFNNDFDPSIVNTLITKIKFNRLKKQTFPTPTINSTKYIAVPFIDNYTNQKISQILRHSIDNLKISYKTKNNLSTYLSNSKDKMDTLSKSGIYLLKCGSCNSSYVGRTCRPLKTRINEHLTRPNSAFGDHLRLSNHNFSPTSNSKILHNVSSKNFNRLDFLEDLEIKNELKSNNSCLNTQVNLNRSYIPLHRRLLD